MTTALPDLPSTFEELDENVVERLWKRKTLARTTGPGRAETIRRQLGWLDCPSFA